MVKQYQCRSCGVAIPTSSVSHLCSPCLQEHYYVQRKCAPAKRLGLPADLTPSQWKNTLSHFNGLCAYCQKTKWDVFEHFRSEEHTSELQSHSDLVCRLLLEKKKKK